MPSAQNISQEFIIEEAYITSERMGSDEFDISSLIAEIVFYESLETPYITGTIAILDDSSLFTDIIGFKGTEKLTITISSSMEESSKYSITKTFIMTEIVTSKKTSDKAEVFVISLVEPHAFLDAASKISKSYTGKFEDITSAIIISELNLDVDFSYITPSIQSEVKVVIPYLSPMQAAKWLMSRATTVNGSPYWVYATLYDDRIRISSFDGMYSKTPFNEKLPYLFSSALTNSVQDLGPEYQNMLVKEVNSDNRQNTFNLVIDGAIGSELSSTDVFENRTLVSKHRAGKTLQRLKQNEIIPSNGEQSVYDSDQIMVENANNTLHLDDLNSRVLHSITSHGTYCTYNSYHDVFDVGQVGDKQRNISIRSLLSKNPIDVTVSGLAIFLGQATVGDTVRINFLNSDTSSDARNVLDGDKSGDYMITNIRHTFKQTIHNATMTVTKLNKMQYGSVI